MSENQETARGTAAQDGVTTENETLRVIDPLYKRYVKSVLRALSSSNFYYFFMDALETADNEFQFSNRRMEKLVDLTWVDQMEKALEGFQNIVSSPRNVIKEDELVVNVANARKAGSDVVRHLAQHAALVEDFNADSGDVRPSRLMQKYREDTINLYENRVVFTTLESAFHFVKIRHDALFEAMSDEFGAKLKMRSDMASATEIVHMDMFLHIRDVDSALDTDDKNREVFDRISRLHRMLSNFMHTPFAQKMMKYARVRGSITKTNVLKKNPNYRKIVDLFEFLSGYGDVGYTIKITEQNPEINEGFQRDLYHNILFNYLVLKGHLERDRDRRLPSPPEEETRRERTLRPKVITEIIEELTEDYDLPDVEIRKVLIEELTKDQLMEEEEAERLRLIEEREQRKREEEERLRREREAEEARLRHEMEVEQERIRHEQEAEEQRLLIERMEREQEDRRRGGLFRKEIELLWENLEERLLDRRKQAALQAAGLPEDYADAARILEEADRLRQEEAEREKQRLMEEEERQKYEEMLAAERARREEDERQERLRQAMEAEERARDRAAVAVYAQTLVDFQAAMEDRLRMRAHDAEKKRREQEAREADRLRRQQARQSSAQ